MVKVDEERCCEQRRRDLRQEHGRRGDTHAQQAKTYLRVDAGECGDTQGVAVQRVAHERVDKLVRAHRRPSSLEAVRDDAQLTWEVLWQRQLFHDVWLAIFLQRQQERRLAQVRFQATRTCLRAHSGEELAGKAELRGQVALRRDRGVEVVCECLDDGRWYLCCCRLVDVLHGQVEAEAAQHAAHA